MGSISEKHDLTTGNLLKKLILFALPLLVTGVLQFFFTTTDLFVVGRFGNGNESLSAVGSCGTIVNLIVGSAIGLSAGLNILVGNTIGEKDETKLDRIIHSCFVVALIIGVILGALGFVFARQLLEITSVDALTIDQAEVYLKIYFLGAPFIALYNFASAILRGYGDSKTPLIILTCAGVMNVGFNFLFVVGFDMDVAGVALGTILAQGIAAVAAIIYLSVSQNVLVRYQIRKTRIYWPETKEMLRLGLTAACQSIFFNISNVIITAQINKFGPAVMAGNTAAANIDGYIYCILNSFSVGAMAVIAQNYGARKFDRVKKALIYTIVCISITAGIAGIIAYLLRKPLLSIFVTDKGKLDPIEVFKAGEERVAVLTTTYFTCGIMEAMCSYYRGLKFSIVPTIVSLTGSVILRILFIYIIFKLPYFHTLSWLLAMYPISWLITIGIYWTIYPKYTRKAMGKNENWRENAISGKA